eukprot:5052601-Karenia_brevis.AAC.1
MKFLDELVSYKAAGCEEKLKVVQVAQTLLGDLSLKGKGAFVYDDPEPRLKVAKEWGCSRQLLNLGPLLACETVWSEVEWRGFLTGSLLLVEAVADFNK